MTVFESPNLPWPNWQYISRSTQARRMGKAWLFVELINKSHWQARQALPGKEQEVIFECPDERDAFQRANDFYIQQMKGLS